MSHSIYYGWGRLDENKDAQKKRLLETLLWTVKDIGMDNKISIVLLSLFLQEENYYIKSKYLSNAHKSKISTLRFKNSISAAVNTYHNKLQKVIF